MFQLKSSCVRFSSIQIMLLKDLSDLPPGQVWDKDILMSGNHAPFETHEQKKWLITSQFLFNYAMQRVLVGKPSKTKGSTQQHPSGVRVKPVIWYFADFTNLNLTSSHFKVAE